MTTDTGDFQIERYFELPPARLWHLLSDTKMREIWGAPGEGTVLTMLTSDLRVGGLERHRCGPADNPDFEVETRWYHLNAPNDAVFTETIEIGGQTLFTSLITYRLTAKNDTTRLNINVSVSSFCGPEALVEVQQGWESGLDKLIALSASQS